MPHTIAIIGAGFSGSLTALNILRQPNAPGDMRVVLIDPRGTFGPGLAYTVPSPRFKLNVRAKAMGAFPQEPEGFLHWLQRGDKTVSGESFISRQQYGLYLAELVSEAAQREPQRLALKTDEVVEVTQGSDGSFFTLLLASGEQLEAASVVLAIGNILRRGVGDVGTKGALREPFNPQSYRDLDQLRELFILGSSLTAVDVIMESEGRGFKGHYSVVSRKGRFPLSHEDPASFPSASLPPSWENPGTAFALLKTIRKASRACGSSQPVFDAMRPKIQQMWTNLSLTERRAFLRHLRPFWEIHRHRIPHEHLQAIRELQAAGRLTIRAGKVSEISAREAVVTLRGCGGEAERLRFDAGFMCAGPEGDIRRIDHPLVASLVAQQLIRPGQLALGLDTEGVPHRPNFAVVGPLQKEVLWEITAVRELRERAQHVAASILGSTH